MNEYRDFVFDIGRAVTCDVCGYSMMGQQTVCGRRVFRCDDVGFGKRSEGADGQIVEMPDWDCNKREGSCLTRLAGANP
jgi:hypothetical protein